MSTTFQFGTPNRVLHHCLHHDSLKPTLCKGGSRSPVQCVVGVVFIFHVVLFIDHMYQVQYYSCIVLTAVPPPYAVRTGPAPIETASVTSYHQRDINRNKYKQPKSVRAMNNQLPTATPSKKVSYGKEETKNSKRKNINLTHVSTKTLLQYQTCADALCRFSPITTTTRVWF